MLDQGTVKGKSKKGRYQELQSNSQTMSLSAGTVKTKSKYGEKVGYKNKSIKLLQQGIVLGPTPMVKEAYYMAKSVENLDQGTIKGRTVKDKESMYIRKSHEAIDQGTIKGISKKSLSQKLGSNSQAVSFYPGNIKGPTEKSQNVSYQKKSQKLLEQGIVLGRTRQWKKGIQ